MAESALPPVQAKAPTFAAVEAICAAFGDAFQFVFVAIEFWPENKVSEGSGRGPEMPNAPSAGPLALMRTCFGALPVITNPAIWTLDPDSTAERVEMLVRIAVAPAP